MIPKVIDLFSGCGGLALGFEKAGFEIAGGLEIIPEACDTATSNLCWRYGKSQGSHITGDITRLGPDIFRNSFGREGCIVIGGPPCQAYSLAGRAKLRSLGSDRINTSDSRGYLYQDFLRFAVGLNARAVVMENVPEAVNYGGKNIPETVCSALEEHGYRTFWTVLNSADFGVPQIRERVFAIGIKEGEPGSIELPVPTNHSADHFVTMHQKMFDSFRKCAHFRTPNAAESGTPSWVTVGDALSDLPVLYPDYRQKYRLLPMNLGLPYRSEIQNGYQKSMRGWYGTDTEFVTANCYRKTERDFPIFARMKQGDNYLDASEIADRIFDENEKIYNYPENSENYLNLKKKTVPPYARDKFPDKWKKLCEDRPSHTLVAHLSVDTYSHIHPWEPRGISVREAARIQSFPDDFYFNCSMGDAFRQIGNAVPPLLSLGIARQVMNAFVQEGEQYGTAEGNQGKSCRRRQGRKKAAVTAN